jgi:hypothetical protein
LLRSIQENGRKEFGVEYLVAGGLLWKLGGGLLGSGRSDENGGVIGSGRFHGYRRLPEDCGLPEGCGMLGGRFPEGGRLFGGCM